ncbi:MAG: hypothetical protein ACR2LN_04070 [Candidatus Levyibacteriota bacterium]
MEKEPQATDAPQTPAVTKEEREQTASLLSLMGLFIEYPNDATVRFLKPFLADQQAIDASHLSTETRAQTRMELRLQLKSDRIPRRIIRHLSADQLQILAQQRAEYLCGEACDLAEKEELLRLIEASLVHPGLPPRFGDALMFVFSRFRASSFGLPRLRELHENGFIVPMLSSTEELEKYLGALFRGENPQIFPQLYRASGVRSADSPRLRNPHSWM